ncbi:MAG: hypothetical protein OXI67_12705 [Candidatus Poribacteria bacterium]|nr:hypothetical protein [Candidatus Poribacteria bacterium]
MANRPIFIPDFNGFPYVDTIDIEFKWHLGFAKSQMQKTILSLHEAAKKQGIAPILEISRKSASRLGVSLSAFNLPLETISGQKMSVECAYQGAKYLNMAVRTMIYIRHQVRLQRQMNGCRIQGS